MAGNPEDNLYCDQANCSNPSIVFGFLRSGVKFKVCPDHYLSLVNKQIPTFSIAAFHFIETIKDAAVYEDRKELVERGRGVISTLESRCEVEWLRAQERIQANRTDLLEVVEKTHREMWEKGKRWYEESLGKLRACRIRLERVMKEKQFQLSPQDLTLCGGIPEWTPFRLVVGDCRVNTVETLLSRFHMLSADYQEDFMTTVATEQARLGRADIAHEVSLYAKELGYAYTDYQTAALRVVEQSTQQLDLLFHKDPAKKCLAESRLYVKVGEYELARQQLDKGRELLTLQGMRQ